MARIKIPQAISNEVMFKSNGLCYCGKIGDQIHHVDDKNDNNDFDNLVFVCFAHHDDASVKGGLRRRDSPAVIKLKRNQLYKDNDEKRKAELLHYREQLKTISQENLRQAALDANIVMKVIEIRDGFFDLSDWEKRGERLSKLRRYSEYVSLYSTERVIQFLMEIAGWTRNKMTWSFAVTLQGHILDFFPYSDEESDQPYIVEIARKCAHAGSNMVYDALIYLDNFAVAGIGLEILKYVYRRGKELEISDLCDMVLTEYADLEGHMDRPEPYNLRDAKRLIACFKADLNKRGLGTPDNIDRDLLVKVEGAVF